MNANEIVNVLRACGNGNSVCEKCPFYIREDSNECRFNAIYESADTIEAQQHEIEQQIKWNEAHTKARVEQGELIKDLKKQLQQYDADRIMEQQNCGELCKEAIELQQQIQAQQQEIDRLKDRNVTYVNENANQAKEIERLNEVLDDWKYNAKCDADHIAGLIADKDEQAGRIMELDNGLKKLRTSFQWLLETNRHVCRIWTKEKIQAIDALLGGNEDA